MHDDRTAKYGWIGAEDSTGAWAARNGCKDVAVETLVAVDVRCVQYEGCQRNAEVGLCTISGGGHTWPDGADVLSVVHQGRTTHAVQANEFDVVLL